MDIDSGVYKKTLGWFSGYVRMYLDSPPSVRENIVMKLQHSVAVAREMESLARSLAMNEASVNLARIIGLLHDVGRFEQFVQFNTFNDKLSVDHGRLGAQIIETHGALEHVQEDIRRLVCWVIKAHNRAAMPAAPDETYYRFGAMLRDADKLDIFRIMLTRSKMEIDAASSRDPLLFSRSNGISPAVAKAVQDHRMVEIDHVRHWHDMLMLRMSWVFDINFNPTFKQLLRRGYLESLCHLLPSTEQVGSLYALIRQHVEDAVAGGID